MWAQNQTPAQEKYKLKINNRIQATNQESKLELMGERKVLKLIGYPIRLNNPHLNSFCSHFFS